MTKYVGSSNEELVSAFIVSTCQLLPKSIPVLSDHMQSIMVFKYTTPAAPAQYSIVCGSSVELYIRPLNPCVGDLDFLLLQTDELAFSDHFPVLPSDISGLADTIQCCKIEPYIGYPSFVRLQVLGDMNYDWKNKKYKFSNTAVANRCLWVDMDYIVNKYSPTPLERNAFTSVITGPAVKHRRERPHSTIFGSDIVRSVWCPQWPKEVSWLRRPKINGWPTIDTMAEVVQNGCHVVYVQHHSFRDDQFQWRLSFSLAEVILIQSWTPIQQIVYHLLRFLAKRELIQKNCPKEDEVLCPYHLKTLMLWTCEEMPPVWWNSSSVIAICCELLKRLSEWMKKRCCPNYFIPEANLLREPLNSKMFEKSVRLLNELCCSENLCRWFIENYIFSFIHTHFRVESTLKEATHFMDYMLPLLESWKLNESKSLSLLFLQSFMYSHRNCRFIIKNNRSAGLRLSLRHGYNSRCIELIKNNRLALTDLGTIQNVSCFTYYDIALYLMHIAYGLGCGEISLDSSLVVEFVHTISMQPKLMRSLYHNFPKTYTEQSSQFQFLSAQDLLQNLTGSNSSSEFRLVSLMSKENLKKAVEYSAFESNGIKTAALTYLAAVHFAESEYEQAMGFCSSVLVDHSSEDDDETLNAGCLLFIDDVARLVGLCALHKKITDNNLLYINRRLYLDLRLSPKAFAHYLTASIERIHKHVCVHHNLPVSALPMNRYLKTLLKRRRIVYTESGTHVKDAKQIVYRRIDSSTVTEAACLIPKEQAIGILMEYALDNMTTFYNAVHKDFGIQCSTVDVYRALNLYKCRRYNEALHLYERILNEPELQGDLKKLALTNVLVIPPIDSLFDGDVQSLLGFHTLFYYLSPSNGHMCNAQLTIFSSFKHCFARYVYYYKCELDFLIQGPYFVKCHYFLGRHFLARYLKVRCCIDCNLPYKEAVTEFAVRKAKLPFEQVIRTFLLRKLRMT